MNKNRKSGAAGLYEGWRHAISKFSRAVSMKILIEDRMRATMRRNLRDRRLSVSEGKLMMKSLDTIKKEQHI